MKESWVTLAAVRWLKLAHVSAGHRQLGKTVRKMNFHDELCKRNKIDRWKIQKPRQMETSRFVRDMVSVESSVCLHSLEVSERWELWDLPRGLLLLHHRHQSPCVDISHRKPMLQCHRVNDHCLPNWPPRVSRQMSEGSKHPTATPATCK
jgi:hypothetical protein